jgi:hypothetical protein
VVSADRPAGDGQPGGVAGGGVQRAGKGREKCWNRPGAVVIPQVWAALRSEDDHRARHFARQATVRRFQERLAAWRT